MMSSVNQSKRNELPRVLAALSESMIGTVFMNLGRAPAIKSIRFINLASYSVDAFSMGNSRDGVTAGLGPGLGLRRHVSQLENLTDLCGFYN
jgi:hypothetical protein